MSRLGKFFETFSSAGTVHTYSWCLTGFFGSVYGKGDLESQAERYFQEARNREEDVRAFFAKVKDKPPKSVSLYLTAVRSLFTEENVELPSTFWKRLRGRKKGTRALTLDKVPSNAELKMILAYMPINGRALYLVLASSGMRIGEALSLNLGDIDLTADPVKIRLNGETTKTGNSRITFTSNEAKEALEEWLKVRDQYLVEASAKSKPRAHYKAEFNGKDVEDDRIFPFEDNTAYAVWNNALKKAGFLEKDRSTNRHTIHPHVLRKFFRTRLGGVIPVDVAEALMGHEGYLTEVYRRYGEEDLAKFYKTGEGSLLVFSNGVEVSKLRFEVEEKNKQLQTIVNSIVSENIALKQRVDRLGTRNEDLEGRLQRLTVLWETVDQSTRELAESNREIVDELRKYGYAGRLIEKPDGTRSVEILKPLSRDNEIKQ